MIVMSTTLLSKSIGSLVFLYGFLFLFFLDKNNRYTSRFLGFSVYISNTTNKGDGALCFKDNFYLTATIPNPVNITCIQNGRYVIFYNNRTHPPYPDGYSTYAYSELCEVQVYGKLILPQQNFFSDFINVSCISVSMHTCI